MAWRGWLEWCGSDEEWLLRGESTSKPTFAVFISNYLDVYGSIHVLMLFESDYSFPMTILGLCSFIPIRYEAGSYHASEGEGAQTR